MSFCLSNLKVHYHVHKNHPWTLSWVSSIQSQHSYPISLRSTLILYSYSYIFHIVSCFQMWKPICMNLPLPLLYSQFILLFSLWSLLNLLHERYKLWTLHYITFPFSCHFNFLAFIYAYYFVPCSLFFTYTEKNKFHTLTKQIFII
jgi:hypothetical protein